MLFKGYRAPVPDPIYGKIGHCPYCNAPIENVIMSIDGGVVSERAYRCAEGCGLVGYWAYGDFDPKLPYTEPR